MKQKTGRLLLSFLLTLMMVIGLMPGLTLTAHALPEVKYLDASGKEQSITEYSVVNSNMTDWYDGWYVVNDEVEINLEDDQFFSNGDVNLILCDGAKLTVKCKEYDALQVDSLTIYAQSTGGNMGVLDAISDSGHGMAVHGSVTINGGNVKLQGHSIPFYGYSNSTATINGGIVTATHTVSGSSAIWGFNPLTINGGTLNSNGSTGICCNSVIINGGTVNATTDQIRAIDVQSELKINGGNVTVIGNGNNSVGIACRKSNSIVLINGGNFIAVGNARAISYVTVKNAIAGTGWTNTEGTQGETDIEVNEQGQDLSSFKKVQFLTVWSVTITPGSNMTKTADSGSASQGDLSGAMTDVVYTADEGYYFPENYSVESVNGISVTRDSSTQITVSGTPAADTEITLTAPTAKAKPKAPAATAVNCTTADNNDGKLTGVTADMEYKKSDAADWTAGTGGDITGLVPGTYYVRVKATDTTLASDNQELTIKGFISYTVTFKVLG